MRRGHWHQVDEASLQTDVMRFMAIVAFCLIAILAMVRNVSPAAPQPADEPAPQQELAFADPAPAQTPARTPEPEPEDKPAPAALSPAEPIPPQPAIREQRPTPKAEPFAVATMSTERAESPPPAVPEHKPELEPQAQPTTQSDDASEDQPVAKAPTEAGLTLRFSSESDFLRLVARGKVAVYAYDRAVFLALSPDYKFQQSQPPRQVYELESSTIPAHMIAALPAEAVNEQFKWAVGLPRRVERQIRQYVDTVASGQLLINRYEEVRHVPAG